MSDTAIEALRYSEFPNSSDCIDRQAAIDVIDKGAWTIEWDKYSAKMMIENVPSAPQWHLMTETPEIENDYLVTLRGAYGRNWIEIASYNRDDGWDMWSKELDVTDCIAWAEMPEPYKGDRDR